MRRSTLTFALALLVVLIAAALDVMAMALLWTRGMPQGADNMLAGTIIGAWNAAAGGVLNYYYGRSSDSDRKTELLASGTPAVAPNAVQAVDQAERQAGA